MPCRHNIDDAIRILPLLVEGKFQMAMGKLHTKPELMNTKKSKEENDKDQNNGD